RVPAGWAGREGGGGGGKSLGWGWPPARGRGPPHPPPLGVEKSRPAGNARDLQHIVAVVGGSEMDVGDLAGSDSFEQSIFPPLRRFERHRRTARLLGQDVQFLVELLGARVARVPIGMADGAEPPQRGVEIVAEQLSRSSGLANEFVQFVERHGRLVGDLPEELERTGKLTVTGGFVLPEERG